jgi:hypothetical protein
MSEEQDISMNEIYNKMFKIYNYYTNDISNNEKILETFSSQSVTQDISMNEIINKMFNMYNNYTFNTSNNSNDTSNDTSNNEKILETFYLLPLTDDIINEFNNFKRNIESLGIYINFTALELYNVMKNFELKASFLTTEQKSNRKKILTFIKNELIKFKDSGKLNTLINSDFSKPPFGPSQSTNVQVQEPNKWCYLYTDCNRTRIVLNSTQIQDVVKFNHSNFPIKSLSSSGVVITGYTELDFRGVEYKFIPPYSDAEAQAQNQQNQQAQQNIQTKGLQMSNFKISNDNTIIDINCLQIPLKSLIITPIQSAITIASISTQPPKYMPPELKENALATYTFFQNTIDLFLNDIDPEKTCPICTSSTCPACPAEKVCPICQSGTCQTCPVCPICPMCPTCPTCQTCQTCQTCERCEKCPPEKVCPVCPAEKVCPVCPAEKVCPPEKVCPVCPAEKVCQICPAEKVCQICPAEKDITIFYFIIIISVIIICVLLYMYVNKKQ